MTVANDGVVSSRDIKVMSLRAATFRALGSNSLAWLGRERGRDLLRKIEEERKEERIVVIIVIIIIAMHATPYSDVSIVVSQFLLKLTGVWMTMNDGEKRRRRIAMAYTFVIQVYGLYLNIGDIYHSWDDLSVRIWEIKNYIESLSFIIIVSPFQSCKNLGFIFYSFSFKQFSRIMKLIFWSLSALYIPDL